MKKVLVIGGGGREHAIVDAISRSPQVGKIYCAPGNAGISAQAEWRVEVQIDRLVRKLHDCFAALCTEAERILDQTEFELAFNDRTIDLNIMIQDSYKLKIVMLNLFQHLIVYIRFRYFLSEILHSYTLCTHRSV